MPAQTVIKLRRSTTSEWEAAQAAAGTTPILSFGEPGFDTTVNKIKIGNGTDTWEELSYASGGGITVAENAPFSPQQGDLWFNSDNAVTYIYYDSYWVDLIPAIAGPAGANGATGPTGPTGPSGVATATSPLTYNSGTQTIGITQSAIAINMSQVATTTSDKSASYTLVAADENTYIRSTGAAITITVPDVLANGESVNFIQAGAGQITFAGSGVTINSADAKLKTNKQFSGATIVKVGGAYYLVGDLAA
jgi:hypothetical protein